MGRWGIASGACWILLIAATAAWARPVPEELSVYPSRFSGFASFVTAQDGGPIPIESTAPDPVSKRSSFLREYGHLFGVASASEQLVTAASRKDAIGQTHTTYQQIHQGIVVFSGVLKVHQSVGGAVLAANGDFYPIPAKLDTEPTLDAQAAIAQVVAEYDTEQAFVESTKLVIVDPGWYGDPPRGAHLAYHIVVGDLEALRRDAFFVDAHTGAILDRWSMTHDARARRIHDADVGSDCCYVHGTTGCDDSACEAVVCDLRPACCENEWTSACSSRAVFYCDGLCLPGPIAREEGDPATGTPDVDAAYDYLGDVYDYLDRAFGRDGPDALGMPIVATVNSVALGCPNAAWNGAKGQMIFCAGATSDDVVAHEYAHAVTDFTANLIYQNQSGQLNESYSDVFGELVDLFNGDVSVPGAPAGAPWQAHPTGPGLDTPNQLRTSCSNPLNGYDDGVRWLIGEDSIAFGGAIRDMWDPTCYGDPGRANSPLQTCDIFDGGGVHSGSGIPNHAFALLTDGGSFNGFDVAGIGAIKAGAVWYRALTTYLTIASDFEEAFTALNQSAADLVGTYPLDPRTGALSADAFTSDDARQVDQALRATEMNTRGRCGKTVDVLDSTPVIPCSHATILFSDDFESGAGGWSASNAGPFGPPTPYDWVLTGDPLPFGRLGVAWYCEDRSVGDCDEQDESAVHSLMSPPIALPEDATFAFMAFTHYIESETGWDGGQLSFRVNGETWQLVSRSAYLENGYSARLRAGSSRNYNPLADQVAWTGVGGRWGTSVVSLDELAVGGDVVEFRFDFGKDGCGGEQGWWVDDFTVYTCPDCNRNGVSDQREIRFVMSTDVLGDMGTGSPQSITLVAPPLAASDVAISVRAQADLASDHEYLSVTLNGQRAGRVFRTGAADCPSSVNEDTLLVPADVFNELADGGDVTITLTATDTVSGTLCSGRSFVMMSVSYDADHSDGDGDGIPDECQNCVVSAEPAQEPGGVEKNRYLSFVPDNPGRHTAFRVTAIDLPESLASWVGVAMWAAAPRSVSELPNRADGTPPVFAAASLSCEPLYSDWTEVSLAHLFGPLIVPGGLYGIEAVDLACGDSEETNYSSALIVATSQWGDVLGNCDDSPCPEPDGLVDIFDIASLLDKFRSLPGAPIKARADLAPLVPDRVIDISDVLQTIDAFGILPYPFQPNPQPCTD